MAPGYSRSDSVLRSDNGHLYTRTDNARYSSNIQEHGKQQQRRVVSMKPQGSPKRPQSQESPGRRSQSQVTVAQANSTMKPQASPAQKIPKENPAGQSQGILIQNGFTLQSTGLISSSCDSGFTTADKSHAEPKKEKKSRVIQVKECNETIDNVKNEALVKPRTHFASPVNEARGRSVPRCISFLNMADGAKDVSTPSAERSTLTRPTSTRKVGKARTASSPPSSARMGAKSRSAQRTPSSKSVKSRTVSMPPRPAPKSGKVRQSSSSAKSSKSRTASSPPSSTRKSAQTGSRDTPSRGSTSFSDYSDITILSNITILSLENAKQPYKHRVPPSKKLRQSPETGSDYNYSDDFEDSYHGEFLNENRSPMIPEQYNYESDFEADSDGSIEDQSPSQKQRKKNQVKRTEPSSGVFHAKKDIDAWRPKTSATYCIARSSDSDDDDKDLGKRRKKQRLDRPYIKSPRATPYISGVNRDPARPTAVMTIDYDADSEEEDKFVNWKNKKNNYFGPVDSQPAHTRIETPEDSFFNELEGGTYGRPLNTPDFLQPTPPRKFKLPDANGLVDIIEGSYDPTKNGDEPSRPATHVTTEGLVNDGHIESTTAKEEIATTGKDDDSHTALGISWLEDERNMKTPTDEEVFDRPIFTGEPPTPAYAGKNHDDVKAEGGLLDKYGRGTPASDFDDSDYLDDFVASSSGPRASTGLQFDNFSLTDDEDDLDDFRLSYDEPRYIQSSLGDYLEAKGELEGMKKEDFKLDLEWVGKENPTPRASLTYSVRKELAKKLRPRSVTVIGLGLTATDEDARARYKALMKAKLNWEDTPQEEVKMETKEEEINTVENKEEETVNVGVKDKEDKEIKTEETNTVEKKIGEEKEVKEDVKEEVKEEAFRKMNDKGKKKEGRVRKLFRRVRRIFACCVRKQEDI